MSETLLQQILNDEIDVKYCVEWLQECIVKDEDLPAFTCSKNDFVEYFTSYIRNNIKNILQHGNLELTSLHTSKDNVNVATACLSESTCEKKVIDSLTNENNIASNINTEYVSSSQNNIMLQNVTPDIHKVNFPNKLDKIASLYSCILTLNLVADIVTEINILIEVIMLQLVNKSENIKKTNIISSDLNNDPESLNKMVNSKLCIVENNVNHTEENTNNNIIEISGNFHQVNNNRAENLNILHSIHNCVYFAIETLQLQKTWLAMNFDKTNLKLLHCNITLQEFSPSFGTQVDEICQNLPETSSKPIDENNSSKSMSDNDDDDDDGCNSNEKRNWRRNSYSSDNENDEDDDRIEDNATKNTCNIDFEEENWDDDDEYWDPTVIDPVWPTAKEVWDYCVRSRNGNIGINQHYDTPKISYQEIPIVPGQFDGITSDEDEND